MSSPAPKSLILNLMRAAEGRPVTAADAMTSAALFGIRENSVRVTLVRLVAGLLWRLGWIDAVHYVGGSQALPPPLTLDEERLAFFART